MRPFDDDVWELYHVADDPSEVHDLAADEPERLARMVERWWEEAARYHVLPLDNRILLTILNPPPTAILQRSRYRYLPHGAPVPESVAVDVRNRSHDDHRERRRARRTSRPTGVLLALGCVLGGWSFHVLDGRLRYVHNLYGKTLDVITSDVVVGAGLRTRSGSATRRPTTKGVAASCSSTVTSSVPARSRRFTPTRYNNTGAGLSCGYELGPPVGEGYEAPFRFIGTIHDVVVDVNGEAPRNPLAEFERIMSQQ